MSRLSLQIRLDLHLAGHVVAIGIDGACCPVLGEAAHLHRQTAQVAYASPYMEATDASKAQRVVLIG